MTRRCKKLSTLNNGNLLKNSCHLSSNNFKSHFLNFFAYMRSWNIVIFLSCVLSCLGFIVLDYSSLRLFTFSTTPLFSKHLERQMCPNVLTSMLSGTWLKRNLSALEETEIDMFLLKARKGHSLPPTLQRPDGKCGNVTFDWLKSSLHPLLWFRALCNRKGDKPCCKNGLCTSASEEQCRCLNCYDMRQPIHAEYSKWIPKNFDCHPVEFIHTDACEVLKGNTLHFIGDSFVRHIYTALVLLLKNDLQQGAIRKGTKDRIKNECTGMYMFTEKLCRMWLDLDVSACNGSVKVKFREQPTSAYGRSLPRVATSLAKTNKSMLIIGIGIHEDYKAPITVTRFLKPLITHLLKSKQVWPKVLWASPHAPGLLKTPRIPLQNYQSVLKYNKVVNQYLHTWGIPVYDTFNLTDGVMSFDGAHYGHGLNMVKVQVLLNHILELSVKGFW